MRAFDERRRRLLALAWLAAAALPSSAFAAEGQGPGLAVGDVPPTFAGRQLDGTEVQLDLDSGKACVVTFWASWCGPCLQELNRALQARSDTPSAPK